MFKAPDVPNIFNQAQFLVDRHVAEGRGGNIAILCGERRITYAQLSAMVNRTGNALKQLGVEIENRVMLILPDSPELIYCYLGAMKIGAVPIPVNTLASPADYRYFLKDSRAKIAVVSRDVLSKVEQIKGDLEHLRRVVSVGEAAPGVPSYEELVADASETLDSTETSRDDMAFWMYTSGTTGAPKAVVHLHHDLLYYWPPYCEEVLGVTRHDIVLATSKMFFSYGRNSSLELPLMYGTTVALHAEWPKAEEILDDIERYRPTLFFSVPSFYSALIRHLDTTPRTYDLSSIRLCVSAGEALPKHIYERWEDRFGVPILDGLGSTDVGGIYLSNRPGDVRLGSSGKMLSGFEWKLVDGAEKEVSSGEVGTLWLKNDGIASFYWNQHQRNKQVFRGEWFNTGDQFYQDAGGYFWYQSREDDMMKISGQWVSPLEIEGVLLEHPAVRECGVIGSPDESGLMKVKAVVVPSRQDLGSPEVEKELIAFVRERVAHFKSPRWVRFVPELPRTATGKLRRHALRERYAV